MNRQDAYDLEMATIDAKRNMVLNNPKTKNFNTLLLRAITYLRNMRNIAYDGYTSSLIHFVEFKLVIGVLKHIMHYLQSEFL